MTTKIKHKETPVLWSSVHFKTQFDRNDCNQWRL